VVILRANQERGQAKKAELGRPQASGRDLKKATNHEWCFSKKVEERKISFSTVTNHLSGSSALKKEFSL